MRRGRTHSGQVLSERAGGGTRRSILLVPALAASIALAAAGCSAGSGIGHHYDAIRDGSIATGGATATGPDDAIASQDFGPSASDAGSTGAGPTDSPSTGPATTDPTSSGTIPQASYALMKKLMGKPASGEAWPKSDTGPLTLDRFISLFYVKDVQDRQKELAEQRGFQGAVRAGWYVGNYNQESVWLVRFARNDDAAAMFGSLTLGWDHDSALITFPDTAVQGEGAVTLKPDSQGNVDVRIAFWVGDTFGEIHYWSPKADKATAMAAALKQYNVLLKG